ncbi:MAG TPA: sugar transferase [Geminicoccaceae bacterium]|nr:sugar transferase [Geminicoccaceae bacterium]
MSVALFARYPISRQTLVVLVDAAAITVALPLALVLRENRLPAGDRLAELWASLPLLALAAVTASLLLGSYRAVWRYMGIAEIVRLAQLALLAILLFYLGQFVVDRLEHLPRSAPPIHFLVAMFLLIGARILYGEWCRRGHGRAGGPTRRPLLLVGSGDGAALFIQMLQHQPDRQYDIAGIICDQVARHRSIAGVPVLGGLADFDAVLATLRVQGMTPDRVVVTRPHHELGRDAVYHIMSRADAQGIAVEQLPDLMRFRADTPVAPRAAPLAAPLSDGLPEAVYPRLKRLFDIALSATVLVILAPLLLVAAVAVALFIQRPVMFVQIRPGLHRRPFRLYKLRTMQDPLGPGGRRLADAERTPFVGRLLRRTRLDELPQLWNVLIGDMAIIGPRPLVAADLDAMADSGRARSRARPGITGWAQVNGGQQLDADEKLALDLWYADHASLALDLRIIGRTLHMMLMGERRDPSAIDTARAALVPEVMGAAE